MFESPEFHRVGITNEVTDRLKLVLKPHQAIDYLDKVISPRDSVAFEAILAAKNFVSPGWHILFVGSMFPIRKIEPLSEAYASQDHLVLCVDHNIVRFNVTMYQAL